MATLVHLPIEIEVDRAAGICIIKQWLGNHIDDLVTVEIGRDQAVQIANHLLSEFKVKSSERVTGNEAGFDQFWSTYPVKEAKQTALALWKQNNCADKLDTILQDVARRKDSKQWLDGFIPHPSTYLRQKRYEDDGEAVATPWANAL